jgi:glycosyltransferase involved in cell wall biosynthesis
MQHPTRILVVSSVTPKPTGFGEITLYRHLAEEPKLNVTVVPFPGVPITTRLLRRIALGGIAEGFEVLRRGHRWDAKAYAKALLVKPQIIFTEAAGDGYHSAMRLARQTGIPLLARFSDWWPDLVPKWVRNDEEVSFRELYRASKIALCVSAGMKMELGEHADARLLWPIPGSESVKAYEKSPDINGNNKVFKICYSGNLREYAPMLKRALEVMKNHPFIRLEVRGMNPHWPASFREEARRLGLYHEFAPRDELECWLSSADAFLVTSAFEPVMGRLMQTNFPSKLLEFARFGKPLVTWGPDYSSLIRWAQPTGRALCITDSNANALRVAFEKLAGSLYDQKRLGDEARNAMHHEFNPMVIQGQFLQAVHDAALKD